jgi:hypothetical protein
MRRFPSREAEIATLASEIIFGLRENSDDFPSPPVGADELQAILEAYRTAHEVTVRAQGAAAAATHDKDEVLEQFTDAMNDVLRYAEHAAKSDDAKLKNLGWRGRKNPSKTQPPGPPRALEVKREGRGWVCLDWKTPANGDAVSVHRVLTRPSGDAEWKRKQSCALSPWRC